MKFPFLYMRWLYQIISFSFGPPTHPPPTDDPASDFIEKVAVEAITQLLTTKAANMVCLSSNYPSSTKKEVCLLI